MRKYGISLMISLCITAFIVSMFIPCNGMAQGVTPLPPVPVPTAGTSWVSATLSYLPVTLPTWALNPWGATSGTGNFGSTSYNILVPTATVLGGLVPFAPAPVLPPPLPLMIPPVPTRQAAQLTTVALPTPVVAAAPLPVAPPPIISTTQLFLGLLLQIGEESGLFYTNPALFWYTVGLLY
ncbi:MAG: hypothetical protein ACMUJM_14695 [bacterium]